MSSLDSQPETQVEVDEESARVAELLGGYRVLRAEVRNSLDAHELLLQGLPAKALTHLYENLVVLRQDPSFELG
jgi:hypothetical protein